MKKNSVGPVVLIDEAFIATAKPAALRAIKEVQDLNGLPLYGYAVGDTGYMNVFVKQGDAVWGQAKAIEEGFNLETEESAPAAQDTADAEAVKVADTAEEKPAK